MPWKILVMARQYPHYNSFVNGVLKLSKQVEFTDFKYIRNPRMLRGLNANQIYIVQLDGCYTYNKDRQMIAEFENAIGYLSARADKPIVFNEDTFKKEVESWV